MDIRECSTSSQISTHYLSYNLFYDDCELRSFIRSILPFLEQQIDTYDNTISGLFYDPNKDNFIIGIEGFSRSGHKFCFCCVVSKPSINPASCEVVEITRHKGSFEEMKNRIKTNIKGAIKVF